MHVPVMSQARVLFTDDEQFIVAIQAPCSCGDEAHTFVNSTRGGQWTRPLATFNAPK